MNNIQPQELAKALYDNTAECDQELSFRRGDILAVVQKDYQSMDGWWLCSLKGRRGIAPGNRLRLLTTEATQPTRAATTTARPTADHEQRHSWDINQNDLRAPPLLARQDSFRHSDPATRKETHPTGELSQTSSGVSVQGSSNYSSGSCVLSDSSLSSVGQDYDRLPASSGQQAVTQSQPRFASQSASTLVQSTSTLSNQSATPVNSLTRLCGSNSGSFGDDTRSIRPASQPHHQVAPLARFPNHLGEDYAAPRSPVALDASFDRQSLQSTDSRSHISQTPHYPMGGTTHLPQPPSEDYDHPASPVRVEDGRVVRVNIPVHHTGSALDRVSQPISQPISQPVSQPVSRAVTQPQQQALYKSGVANLKLVTDRSFEPQADQDYDMLDNQGEAISVVSAFHSSPPQHTLKTPPVNPLVKKLGHEEPRRSFDSGGSRSDEKKKVKFSDEVEINSASTNQIEVLGLVQINKTPEPSHGYSAPVYRQSALDQPPPRSASREIPIIISNSYRGNAPQETPISSHSRTSSVQQPPGYNIATSATPQQHRLVSGHVIGYNAANRSSIDATPTNQLLARDDYARLSSLDSPPDQSRGDYARLSQIDSANRAPRPSDYARLSQLTNNPNQKGDSPRRQDNRMTSDYDHLESLELTKEDGARFYTDLTAAVAKVTALTDVQHWRGETQLSVILRPLRESCNFVRELLTQFIRSVNAHLREMNIASHRDLIGLLQKNVQSLSSARDLILTSLVELEGKWRADLLAVPTGSVYPMDTFGQLVAICRALPGTINETWTAANSQEAGAGSKGGGSGSVPADVKPPPPVYTLPNKSWKISDDQRSAAAYQSHDPYSELDRHTSALLDSLADSGSVSFNRPKNDSPTQSNLSPKVQSQLQQLHLQQPNVQQQQSHLETQSQPAQRQPIPRIHVNNLGRSFEGEAQSRDTRPISVQPAQPMSSQNGHSSLMIGQAGELKAPPLPPLLQSEKRIIEFYSPDIGALSQTLRDQLTEFRSALRNGVTPKIIVECSRRVLVTGHRCLVVVLTTGARFVVERPILVVPRRGSMASPLKSLLYMVDAIQRQLRSNSSNEAASRFASASCVLSDYLLHLAQQSKAVALNYASGEMVRRLSALCEEVGAHGDTPLRRLVGV